MAKGLPKALKAALKQRIKSAKPAPALNGMNPGMPPAPQIMPGPAPVQAPRPRVGIGANNNLALAIAAAKAKAAAGGGTPGGGGMPGGGM